jgi:hypothetical protein
MQMLWGTSSLALYVPWAGRAGPYLSISLWLWLGVLDAIQGGRIRNDFVASEWLIMVSDIENLTVK